MGMIAEQERIDHVLDQMTLTSGDGDVPKFQKRLIKLSKSHFEILQFMLGHMAAQMGEII